MKRKTLAMLIAGTGLLAAATTAGAAEGVNGYLIDAGLLDPAVTPVEVGLANPAQPDDPARAYLVSAGLVEAPTAEGSPTQGEAVALEPEKRYLLEIDSTNYVEIVERLTRG